MSLIIVCKIIFIHKTFTIWILKRLISSSFYIHDKNVNYNWNEWCRLMGKGAVFKYDTVFILVCIKQKPLVSCVMLTICHLIRIK